MPQRRKTVNDRTRWTNRRWQLLKEYFSQALAWAGDPYPSSLQACGLLLRWPTLEAVQKARPAQVRAFYLVHGCRRPELIASRLQEMLQARLRAVITASTTTVQSLAGQTRCLVQAVAQFDRQLKALFEQRQRREISPIRATPYGTNRETTQRQRREIWQPRATP